jgi:hypothetical protein
MMFEPWIAEPAGERFTYMIRICRDDGKSPFVSGDGNKLIYPSVGYVAAKNWEGDSHPDGWDENLVTRRHGGIWGFVDGKGSFFEPAFRAHDQWNWQICKVAIDEIRWVPHRNIADAGSWRVPRTWVCFTGTLIDALAFVFSRDKGYASDFVWNTLTGYAYAVLPDELHHIDCQNRTAWACDMVTKVIAKASQ